MRPKISRLNPFLREVDETGLHLIIPNLLKGIEIKMYEMAYLWH